MIKSIEIKNFQSYITSKKILFHRGVNAIIGPSDSGKSAIKRAICSVTDNKFPPSYIREGVEEPAEITLEIDDCFIKRKKSTKGLNTYQINDEKPLEGFGLNNVPDKMAKIINFNELNVQHQKDSHFLLSETSGEVSRFLNKTVNLEIMDITLKNLNSNYRSVNDRLKFLIAEKDDMEKALSAYGDIEKIEELIIQGESFEKKLLEIKEKKESILKILDDIKVIEESLLDTQNIDEQLALIENALALSRTKTALIEKSSKVTKIVSSIKTIKAKISDCVVSDEEIQLVNKSLKLFKKYQEKEKKINQINNLINDIKSKEQLLKQKEIKIKQLKAQFQKKMPKICPLCEKSS